MAQRLLVSLVFGCFLQHDFLRDHCRGLGGLSRSAASTGCQDSGPPQPRSCKHGGQLCRVAQPAEAEIGGRGMSRFSALRRNLFLPLLSVRFLDLCLSVLPLQSLPAQGLRTGVWILRASGQAYSRPLQKPSS